LTSPFSPEFSPERLRHRIRQIKSVRIQGHFFRLVPAIHAEAIEETGPSFAIGGRYNPRGEFGALYLGQSAALCWKEILKFYQGRTEYVPDQVLGEFAIDIKECLDLTVPKTLETLGVTLEQITEPANHYLTRLIGGSAWSLGIEAIKFPSSADPGQFAVAIFRDHLHSQSKVRRLKITRASPHE
jgi:RES domain-containing protein